MNKSITEKSNKTLHIGIGLFSIHPFLLKKAVLNSEHFLRILQCPLKKKKKIGKWWTTSSCINNVDKNDVNSPFSVGTQVFSLLLKPILVAKMVLSNLCILKVGCFFNSHWRQLNSVCIFFYHPAAIIFAISQGFRNGKYFLSMKVISF